MKRRLLIIAVFLLLGAVVNVAVAWGFALFGVPLRYVTLISYTVERSTKPVWRLHLDAGPGSLGIASKATLWRQQSPEHDAVPSWSRAFKAPNEQDIDLPPLREKARGWPWLALYHRESRVEYLTWGKYEGALVVPWYRPPSQRPVPLIPIWPGMLANTLFYAAILWLLIPGPFALRRFLRVRRGLCPKCAYPLGESAVCTECGIALPSLT